MVIAAYPYISIGKKEKERLKYAIGKKLSYKNKKEY